MLTSERRQKGLNPIQARTVTIFEAWRLLVPETAERPSAGHVRGWIRLANSIDEIIDLIERSAGHHSPRHFVYSELQKINYMRGNHAN